MARNPVIIALVSLRLTRGNEALVFPCLAFISLTKALFKDHREGFVDALVFGSETLNALSTLP